MLGCGVGLLRIKDGRNTDGGGTPLSDRTWDGRGLAVGEEPPEGLGLCVGLPVGEGVCDGEGVGLGEGDGEGLTLGEGEGHGLGGWPQGLVLTADTARPGGNTQMPTIKIPTARTFLILGLCLLDPTLNTVAPPEQEDGRDVGGPGSQAAG